ncbi:MAG: alanine--tRNA ligase [Bacillota bacterium]
MREMTGNELRKLFLNFFKKKKHKIMDSAPLVPQNDPSLLFINAGMAPLKPFFSGEKTPPKNRVATCQKCIRTNDIENVGKTKRHQTFFEMLGNFSFGDYFKEETIKWSWEFVTEELELDEDRLLITIYEEDDEAFEIWNNEIGIPEEKIIRMGKEENFWQIGTGPCGPCSEIHYDRGEEYGSGSGKFEEEDQRFLEIWNLVFTQYNYTENGEYKTLPEKNIDTGMGLERVASVLQGVDSNFETDLLYPIIEWLEKDTDISYKKSNEIKTSYRVIADHVRSVTMAVADGAIPSNEGRGYVLRRLIRRAVRFGGKLNYEEPFLYKIVPIVNEIMGDFYSDLSEKVEHIQKIIKAEEERFLKTLDQGLDILNDMIDEMKKNDQKVLSGKNAFKLYDTYGFPLDLTQDELSEYGFEVDEKRFKKEMKKQKERAREARKDTVFAEEKLKVYNEIKEENDKNEFTGYRNLKNEAKIIGIVKDGERVNSLEKNEKGEIILDRTPFYTESGGQVGDNGIIISSDNKAEVYDAQEKAELFSHYVKVQKGILKEGQKVFAEVYSEKRKATARNHSATHLLHRALKEVLGEHVNQSGSLVTENKLRFDFNHFSALTEEEIKLIEKKVNEKIMKNLPVKTLETTIDKAKDMGAVALFNEKYGKQVRVVKMGEYTVELCGGTHVNFTGEIGLFKIINESGIAAGIRRIEAVTGLNTYKYILKRNKILARSAKKFKTNPENLTEKIDNLFSEQKKLKREIKSLKDKLADFKSKNLKDRIQYIEDDIPVVIEELEDLDTDGLRNLSDELQNELDSLVVLLASKFENKVVFVCSISDDLVEKGFHAGKLISKVAQITGGGGGGRPDMAQAGGSKTEKIAEALKEAKNILKDQN